MAIVRGQETTNSSSKNDDTHAPPSVSGVNGDDLQTGDINQIEKQYQSDAESKKCDGINTGALLPKDMTVKLVREEVANWETFLQTFYSITLTLFGLFLGAWISNSNDDFSSLEVTATISFGVLSLVLIVIWVFLKVKKSKEGIKISSEMLSQISRTDT